MAHRGWDEAHWRKLRAGWPVARLCGARQQPGDWAQNFSPAEATAKLVEALGQ
jgi:hypothetical protein